ncbi:hypothetical protein ACHHYP_14954 [Achlya hypogyna]|uniref:Uncharacterized protein n=1 Tax=Achlya hypogyna TaxID=1202772 RepID=A0A1V9YBW8_ACHHY|nr:hypothetical protein ACHHYP_14954 [Achlya hypogyna]
MQPDTDSTIVAGSPACIDLSLDDDDATGSEDDSDTAMVDLIDLTSDGEEPPPEPSPTNPPRPRRRIRERTPLATLAVDGDELLLALSLFKATHGHVAIPLDFLVPADANWPKTLMGVELGKLVDSLRIDSSQLPRQVHQHLVTLGVLVC